MKQELPSVVIPTPSDAAVVTTVVRKSRWGWIFDICAVLGAFLIALLQSIGDINWTALGFTPTQAAWGGLILFIVRFSLSYRPIRLVETRVEPATPIVVDPPQTVTVPDQGQP